MMDPHSGSMSANVSCRCWRIPNGAKTAAGLLIPLPTYTHQGNVNGEQEVTDIEESVWAPKYGIKGNIDASLMVAFEAGPLQHQRQQRVQTLGQQRQLPAVLAPFEFKTGKPHQSHRAQVRPVGTASFDHQADVL